MVNVTSDKCYQNMERHSFFVEEDPLRMTPIPQAKLVQKSLLHHIGAHSSGDPGSDLPPAGLATSLVVVTGRKTG